MQLEKLLAALAIAGAMFAAGPAFAQNEGGFNPPQETFVGRFMSKTPACPSLDFHLTEATDKKLTGVVFDPAMTGQMSTVTGNVTADGKVHLMMTAMGGKGAAGAIDGAMQGTTMALSMTSATCPMARVELVPVQRVIPEPHG